VVRLKLIVMHARGLRNAGKRREWESEIEFHSHRPSNRAFLARRASCHTPKTKSYRVGLIRSGPRGDGRFPGTHTASCSKATSHQITRVCNVRCPLPSHLCYVFCLLHLHSCPPAAKITISVVLNKGGLGNIPQMTPS